MNNIYNKLPNSDEYELSEIKPKQPLQGQYPKTFTGNTEIFLSFPTEESQGIYPSIGIQIQHNPNLITYQQNSFGQQGPFFPVNNGYFNTQPNSNNNNYYQGNNQPIARERVVAKKPIFEDYAHKQIPNDLFKRTEIVGTINKDEHTEFDDYFEKHADQFFTPAVHEVLIYSSGGLICGIQMSYRDSWGKTTEKEMYKGDLHMPKHLLNSNLKLSKLTLDFDEHITEAYVDGKEYISYVKLVTNKGRQLEAGWASLDAKLNNLLPELANVNAIGGSYGNCLNALYFYYL